MDPSCPSEKSSRFAALNAFVDVGQAQLRKLGCGSAAALWFTLWRFESAESGLVRAGLEALAECFGSDKRNIARMISQLEEYGYLVTVDPGRRGRGICATYRLHGSPQKVLPPHLFEDQQKVSPTHLSEDEKGVTNTPLASEKKGVTNTPFEKEKVSPVAGKGVTMTPVQNVQNKYLAATDAAVSATKAPGKRSSSGERSSGRCRSKSAKPANPCIKLAIDYFCASWKAKKGRPYAFAGGKDAKAVEFILSQAGGDINEFKALVDRYIADERHSFAASNEHDLGTLRIKINCWTRPKAGAVAPVVKVAADNPLATPEVLEQINPPMEVPNGRIG